jgi:hypothetical protein
VAKAQRSKGAILSGNCLNQGSQNQNLDRNRQIDREIGIGRIGQKQLNRIGDSDIFQKLIFFIKK